ncbi:MAG: hypothetical protein ABR591_15320, partial [Candidatus Velthaea sp.]
GHPGARDGMTALSYADIAGRFAKAASMHFDTIVVPAGAEAAVVRRAGGKSRCIAVPAGAASAAALPEFTPHSTVLIVGLCGALDVKRSVGDVVVYDSVDGLRLDAQLCADVQRAVGPTAVRVRATSVERVVCTASAKAALGVTAHAAVVDMESRALLNALRAQDVRVAIVRIVSDGAHNDLPEIGGAYDDAGRLRPFALTFAFLRAPLRSIRFLLGLRIALTALSRTAAALS